MASNGISSLQSLLTQLNTNETKTTSTDKTQGTQASATGSVTAQASRVDQASLSAAGGLAASSAGDSDVRTDKVAQLQQAIASGTYNVPASDVASKLVESLLNGR